MRREVQRIERNGQAAIADRIRDAIAEPPDYVLTIAPLKVVLEIDVRGIPAFPERIVTSVLLIGNLQSEIGARGVSVGPNALNEIARQIDFTFDKLCRWRS